jgi:hypothetical protein
MVSQVTREDVLWDRPVFKAPPLELNLKQIDLRAFADELRRVGPVNR